MLDEEQAIMFGGDLPGAGFSSEVLILHLSLAICIMFLKRLLYSAIFS